MQIRVLVMVSVCLVVPGSVAVAGVGQLGEGLLDYTRGDANADGGTDISDAMFVLDHLSAGGPAPACQASADVNNDKAVDISDPIFLLDHLFNGGSAPPPPNFCGEEDPTPNVLTCEEATCNE